MTQLVGLGLAVDAEQVLGVARVREGDEEAQHLVRLAQHVRAELVRVQALHVGHGEVQLPPVVVERVGVVEVVGGLVGRRRRAVQRRVDGVKVLAVDENEEGGDDVHELGDEVHDVRLGEFAARRQAVARERDPAGVAAAAAATVSAERRSSAMAVVVRARVVKERLAMLLLEAVHDHAVGRAGRDDALAVADVAQHRLLADDAGVALVLLVEQVRGRQQAGHAGQRLLAGAHRANVRHPVRGARPHLLLGGGGGGTRKGAAARQTKELVPQGLEDAAVARLEQHRARRRLLVGGGRGERRVDARCLSPQAPRGQAPDLILADEICFVGTGALVGIIPIMSVRGRKQIHISSHQADSWVNKVATIVDRTTGKSAYHVIDQRFKCAAHASLKSLVCPCQAVFCPSHVAIDDSLKSLLNLVTPGGDIELTGGVVQEEASDVTVPFPDDVLNLFFGDPLDVVGMECRRYYICMDPTYSSGTQSSVGIATYAQLKNSNVIVLLGLDEVLVNDIGLAYNNLYSALVMAHLKMVHDYARSWWPAVHGDEPMEQLEIVFVPEANSYQQPNATLFEHLKGIVQERYQLRIALYLQFRNQSKMWDVGRWIYSNKANMVIALQQGMLEGHIKRSPAVFSFGPLIRNIFLSQRNVLTHKYKLGTDIGGSRAESETIANNTWTKSVREIVALTPRECVAYIFSVMTGRYLCLESLDGCVGEDGQEALQKLSEQLKEVTIKKTDKGTAKVFTGGKKKGALGVYTRDDLFHAVLLGIDAFSPVGMNWVVEHNPERLADSVLYSQQEPNMLNMLRQYRQ